MLRATDLTNEQQDAVDRLYEHDATMLYATMGFGKTVVAYTAAAELLAEKIVSKVLIAAPLRPARDVWLTEPDKWDHLRHLKVASVMGNEAKRLAGLNDTDANVMVINLDNLAWLMEQYKGKPLPFDGIIIDELSKFKDNGTKLVKCLRRRVLDIKWRVGLTGTPAHESLHGLFSQALVLDGGKSYGRNKRNFLLRYFYPVDFEERRWEIRAGCESELMAQIRWLVYQAPDYTGELPPLVEHTERFELSDSARKRYDSLRLYFEVRIDGHEFWAPNAAVLSGKLEQLAAGFLYYDESDPTPRDTDAMSLCASRLMALDDYLTEHQWPRAVICYWFQRNSTELYLFLSRAGKKVAYVTDKGATERWNNGELDYLLLNPRSAGHGLNLAEGGHLMIWYTPCWSNDLFKQTVARLWRRGQRSTVTSVSLIASETVNELMVERVESKEEYDKIFQEHLQDWRTKKSLGVW